MQYFGNMLKNLVYKYADFKFFIPHNMATVDHFFSQEEPLHLLQGAFVLFPCCEISPQKNQ